MTEEYIYLRDYLKVLWKRKWIVILVPIISVITTAIIVFSFQKTKPQPQIYEYVVVIQNGAIDSPVITKEASVEIIKKVFAGDVADKLKVEDISTMPPLFRIKLVDENPDALLQIATRYIDEQSELYAIRYKMYLQSKENLIKQKQILENMLNDLQNAIVELLKINSKDLTELGRFDRLNDYKKRIFEIKNQIIQKESEINNADDVLSNSKQFSIVSSFKNCISVCDKKINKKAKLMLSAIFGIIGGVLLAFAMENWKI